MKVLVTGSAGFFGRAVCKGLVQRGFDVIARNRDALNIYSRIDIYKSLDDSNMNEGDAVVNCAGITGQANCHKDIYMTWQANVIGVAMLAEECRKRGLVLVHPSSVVVFDGRQSYAESASPTPLPGNPYAQTKAVGERVVQNSGVEYIIPRVTTGLGSWNPRDTTNFVKIVVDTLKAKGTARFFSDQLTNPVLVDEVGEAIAALLIKKFRGVINLGGPAVVSMYDLATVVKAEFEIPGTVEPGTLAGTAYPPFMVLETSLANSMGIKFSDSVEAIRRCH